MDEATKIFDPLIIDEDNWGVGIAKNKILMYSRFPGKQIVIEVATTEELMEKIKAKMGGTQKEKKLEFRRRGKIEGVEGLDAR